MKHALRQLAKSPGFTTVALVTLALGIGVNSSMFSVLYALLFHTPYADDSRLVRVYRTSPQSQSWPHSVANHLDHRAQNTSFERIAAISWTTYNLAEPVTVIGVMPARFDVTHLWGPVEAWRPSAFSDRSRQSRDNNYLAEVAHLKPAVALEQAQAEMTALARPIGSIRPLEKTMADSISRQRFAGLLRIYGVMAYTVAQRTGEIGIRLALGAQPGDVLRLILGHGGKLIGLGLLLGLVATLAGGRALESLLYKTDARDPLTLLAITLGLAGVATLACLVPARRATKVDPMVALRSE